MYYSVLTGSSGGKVLDPVPQYSSVGVLWLCRATFVLNVSDDFFSSCVVALSLPEYRKAMCARDQRNTPPEEWLGAVQARGGSLASVIAVPVRVSFSQCM